MKTTLHLAALLILLILADTTTAADPTTKEECVKQSKSAMTQKCKDMFEDDAGQKLCLTTADVQVEQQCATLFGTGDFCGGCVGLCNQAYKPEDKQFTECVKMCASQPGCSK